MRVDPVTQDADLVERVGPGAAEIETGRAARLAEDLRKDLAELNRQLGN